MKKNFTFTDELNQELINLIKATGVRHHGLVQFAKKYDISLGKVEWHFYKNLLTPELDKELPRGKTSPKSFRAKKNSPTEKDGQKPQESPKSSIPQITVEGALRNILKKKNGDTPLTKEDIEVAAQKAGVHYHVALSTWANMIQKGEAAISNIQCTDKNCLWMKGMAFASLLNNGVTATELAKVTGLSPAEVRELAKTYQVFPSPGDREPSLSFYHHRIAANTKNPFDWIKKAKEAGWSTRDMRAAVNGEPLPASVKNSKITVEHILNLTARISELEQEVAALQKQLRTSKKISLTALQLLHSKNQRLNRHLYPVNVNREHAQQAQQQAQAVN